MSASTVTSKPPFPVTSLVIDQSSKPPWRPSKIGNDIFLVVLKGWQHTTAVSDDAGNSWTKVGHCLWIARHARSTASITLAYVGPLQEIEAAAYEAEDVV